MLRVQRLRSSVRSLVEVNHDLAVLDRGGADAARSELLHQASVELVDGFVARVVIEPAVDQFAPGGVHATTQLRHVDRFERRRIQMQAARLRVPAQAARYREMTGRRAAVLAEGTEAHIEIQAQAAAALRNAQARIDRKSVVEGKGG